MAKIRIDGLPATPGVASADNFHTSQSGIDYRATGSEVKTMLSKLSHTENKSAADTDTVNMTYQLTIVQVDTSLGNATITLANGIFDGQQVEVYCNGTGLTYVKGTGIYLGSASLGMQVSNGLVLRATWSATSAKWKSNNDIVADYFSTDQQIKIYAQGNMEIHGTSTVAVSASNTFTYAVPFSSVESVFVQGYHTTGFSGNVALLNSTSITAPSLTTASIRNNSASIGQNVFIKAEGKY